MDVMHDVAVPEAVNRDLVKLLALSFGAVIALVAVAAFFLFLPLFSFFLLERRVPAV